MRAADFARLFRLRAKNLGVGEVRKVFSFCAAIYRWVIGFGSMALCVPVGDFSALLSHGSALGMVPAHSQNS
jgi:hypothetical protein